MGDRADVQSQDEFRSFRLPVRWWVVFEDLEHNSFKRWWHVFTREMFRHCYAFADYEHGVIKMNCGPGGLKVDFANVKAKYLAHQLAKQGKIVIPCDGVITNDFLPRFFPMTCVGVIKHLIGAKSIALTPYQLYRYLVKHHLNMFEYKIVLEAMNEPV